MLRRILAQRRAARERLRRACLLSILLQALLLLALLPLSLPALRAHRDVTPMEVTRVFLQPAPSSVTAVPSAPSEGEEAELVEEGVSLEEPPPSESTMRERLEHARAQLDPASDLVPDPSEEPAVPEEQPKPAERKHLEYVRAHLDPASGPVPENARISTRDQAVAQERRAHARLHATDGSAASGEREAADQAASQAQAAAPQRREATPQEASRQVEARQQPRPPVPAPTQPTPTPAQAERASQPAREAWAPLASRVSASANPERRAPPAPEPELARAGGPRAVGSRPRPPAAPTRPAPALQPTSDPTSAILEATAEEHVPTFLVDPVALARAERQAQAARQEGGITDPEDGQTRREVGSARSAASPSKGSQAAAPSTLVSVEGPPTLDMTTALAARNHPLAQALEALDDALRGGWTIPLDLRISGIVGTTGVAFLIDQRGQISAPTLIHPSGHERLDSLALAAVPQRVRGFRHLLTGEAREHFPTQGLRIEYRFVYEDSPIGAVR